MMSYSVIDCWKKRVRFQLLKAKSFKFQETLRKQAVPTILALKARKLLNNGCIGFLACIVDPSKETRLTPDNDISVVRDYVSIYPKDLPGLP